MAAPPSSRITSVEPLMTLATKVDADRKAVFVRGGGKAGFCNLK